MARSGLLEEGDSLYDAGNIRLLHHLNAALRAHAIYQRDVDYIVKNGEIVIVDEFTGRTMAGRRWSDGLHQAIEAKEGVSDQAREPDDRDHHAAKLFSACTDKLVRYDGYGGHRGGFEFQEDLRASKSWSFPTHKPGAGAPGLSPIVVYKTERREVRGGRRRDRGVPTNVRQPVLVGTISVEKSEVLGAPVRCVEEASSIKHNVLNAKQPRTRSANIIAAGRPSRRR